MTATSSRFSSRSPADERGSVGRWRWAALLAAVVAIALGGAWLLGWFTRSIDPRVLEIRTMREQLAATFRDGAGPANLAEAAAMVTGMNAIRQKIEALPEELRPEAERGGGSVFRSTMRARIDAYFNASPAQRQAVLDRQIDQEEIVRKAFEAAQVVTSAVGGGSAAAGGPPGGGPPRGGPPRGGTEEDRNKWRKSMIDRTSPAERARYVEYRRAMEERREKRGLPAAPWGR